MASPPVTPMYPALHHVGVVVRDIDEASRDNTARFGLSAAVRRMTLHVENGLYRGQTVTYSAEFAFIDLGNTVLELIQPLGRDPSPYRDAIDAAGESTHHLAFIVPSVDEHLKAARKGGSQPIVTLDAKLPQGLGRFLYVEGLVHGVLIELIEFANR
jgi:catechol 2,3-dioxygenase-like lactoylglutathione lyase family enzyme